MSNRREFERFPCTEKVILKKSSATMEQAVEEALFPVYLRDVSEGGISGTCFSPSLPAHTDVFFVEGAALPSRNVKLVWSYQSIESVHMLGFKFVN